MLVKFRRAQENAAAKKVLREEIDELIQQEASNEEIIDVCREHAKKTNLTDVDITVLVSLLDDGAYGNNHWYLLPQLWRCIMGSVEWNKKEELVAEQALKHLKVCVSMLIP